MAQKAKNRRRRHLTPGQKLLLTVVLVIVFALCSTVFLNFRALEKMMSDEAEQTEWSEPVDAYVLVPEGELTAPFYNEGFAKVGDYGRGTGVTLENWEPFLAENGVEYYHAELNGQRGYIPCENVTDDQSDLLQESKVYVRSTCHLMPEPDSLDVGTMAQQGTLLRIVGYDYFQDDGAVNMYHVMMGDEFGWIRSDYVCQDYSESMSEWSGPGCSKDYHRSIVGDSYGGGNAGDLDYWPHEKGDFADQGNAMPQDVYALLIPTNHAYPEKVQEYIDLAKGSAVNTFVITICEAGVFAYESDVVKAYQVPNYAYDNTNKEFAEAVQMLHDAGYYVVGRINTFSDSALAYAHPEWAITNPDGTPKLMGGNYWPSAYSREVWKLRVAFAIEAVDNFGLNEIQFDYVRFPDYIRSYLDEGADLKNTFNESRAQALQRFLTYATDIIHDHGAYVGADVFGETANPYVSEYGQYWPALSNVVDVISGMPYPDHFGSYYITNFEWFVPYLHPYRSNLQWGLKVYERQRECATPAIARTWIQTWDDRNYPYNALQIQRQIVALYDADVPGGYMLWYATGSLDIASKLPGAIDYDYRALYEEAEAQNIDLSIYMGVPQEDSDIEGAEED